MRYINGSEDTKTITRATTCQLKHALEIVIWKRDMVARHYDSSHFPMRINHEALAQTIEHELAYREYHGIK